jgi:hypothetical protein
MQTTRSEMTFLSCGRPIMGLLGDESDFFYVPHLLFCSTRVSLRNWSAALYDGNLVCLIRPGSACKLEFLATTLKKPDIWLRLTRIGGIYQSRTSRQARFMRRQGEFVSRVGHL